MLNDELHVVHARAAGLDVHKMEITATVSLSLNTSSNASPRTRRTWRQARRSGAMPPPPAPTSGCAANNSGSAAPTPSSTTNTPSGGVRLRR